MRKTSRGFAAARAAPAARGLSPLVRRDSSSQRRGACLLVSVRSAAEALVALDGGASFIDVKEPSLGSLGRASREVHVEVLDALGDSVREGRVVATAALGELNANRSPGSISPLRGFSLFKLGLSGCRGSRDWRDALDAWRERVTTVDADLAAVAYADHAACDTPDPREVLEYAADRRLPFFLIDTWSKESGALTDFFDARGLAELIDEAHRHDVSVALAGSLRLEDIRSLSSLGADVFAVRGAACTAGKREDELDPSRIRDLVATLRS